MTYKACFPQPRETGQPVLRDLAIATRFPVESLRYSAVAYLFGR